FRIGPVQLTVLHTPGHSPGSTCFYAADLGEAGVLFSGDTLFSGGPGATGRSYSDFDVIIASIRERILTLPEGTEGLTGHGEATTVGAGKPHLRRGGGRGHSARRPSVAFERRCATGHGAGATPTRAAG